MGRLCERPDCSEPASVAYGMRPEDLVFWLDELRDPDATNGVLCARHADSMTVPRNWTLDDLRDPDLHLFRPPAAAPTGRPRRRSRAANRTEFDQLELDDLDDGASDGGSAGPESAVVESPVVESPVVESPVVESDGGDGEHAWRPDFDADDDLDGLLSARSPLLARAFRGDDRGR